MNIKDKLVRLGAQRPDLRPHIRPILRHMEAADTFKCPECGSKVLEKTGYCVKCDKKVKKSRRIEAAGEAQAEVRFKAHGLYKGKVGKGNLAKAERMEKRALAAYIAEAYDGMEEPYPQPEYWMQYPKAILDITYADLRGG